MSLLQPRAPLSDRIRWSAHLALRAPLQSRVPYWSPRALQARQRRQVRLAIAHAYATVSYYRETMDRLGLTPAAFASAADLARLPILERQQLQRDPGVLHLDLSGPEMVREAPERGEHG